MNRNNHSKFKILMLLMFSTFLLTGCFSIHEPNDLALINVLGIDQSESGDYEVTFLIYRPDAMFPRNNSPTGEHGGIIDSPLLMTIATGKNIFDAYQKTSAIIAKRLAVTHVDAIVFGEDVARKGIGPIFDSMIRDYNFRPNYEVLITKGKAKDILATKPLLENNLGAEVYNINKYNRFKSTPIVHNVAQFLSVLASDTKDPFTAEISKASAQGIGIEELGGGAQLNSDELKQPTGIALNGLAVFKRDKLIGWLNLDEARSVGFLRGEVPTSLITLDCPNDDGTMSIETNKANSSLNPKILNGRLQMDVNINIDATLREAACSSLHLEPNQMKALNNQLEQKMKKQITKVLTKVQTEWQADIFGFGDTIYKHKPAVWKELAPTWRSGGLSAMPVNVKIKANISRAGLMNDPIKANESR